MAIILPLITAKSHPNLSLSLSLYSFSDIQYAEHGKCTHKPFLKKLIAYTKIVALHVAALGLRDLHLIYRGVDITMIFCQVYHNLSVLPHHFHIPRFIHFCFLISMVRLCTNEWTGNLPVILFVAFLMSKLNGEA